VGEVEVTNLRAQLATAREEAMRPVFDEIGHALAKSDSPPFTPPESTAFAARGFERVNRNNAPPPPALRACEGERAESKEILQRGMKADAAADYDRRSRELCAQRDLDTLYTEVYTLMWSEDDGAVAEYIRRFDVSSPLVMLVGVVCYFSLCAPSTYAGREGTNYRISTATRPCARGGVITGTCFIGCP